jgi:hypothetical protein
MYQPGHGWSCIGSTAVQGDRDGSTALHCTTLRIVLGRMDVEYGSDFAWEELCTLRVKDCASTVYGTVFCLLLVV